MKLYVKIDNEGYIVNSTTQEGVLANSLEVDVPDTFDAEFQHEYQVENETVKRDPRPEPEALLAPEQEEIQELKERLRTLEMAMGISMPGIKKDVLY